MASLPGAMRGWFLSIDRWLLLALALGFLSGVQGFGWGRYDCLNKDRMAFRSVMSKDRMPFEPEDFRKPPFYTYVNFFVSRWPADTLARNLPGLTPDERKDLRLRMRCHIARAINLALFAGLVALVYRITAFAHGRNPARMAALLLATSAGFIPYQIFLTCDMLMIFLMVAAFACAVRILNNPSMGISVAAGLLAGIATAAKYNALVVAASLPLAHLLASRGNVLLACLRRPAAWICGLCVPLGFLLANPYALLRFDKVKEDFLYNYSTTPVYGGEGPGSRYGDFFRMYSEIFGWPGYFLICGGVIIGVAAAAAAWSDGRDRVWKPWLLALAVLGLYVWKFGAFPRLEPRFVLPSAPFLLLVGASGFGVLLRARLVTIPLFFLLIAYNLLCAWLTGGLFRNDPRMQGLAWADAHLVGEAVVESSGACPLWKELPGRKLTVIRMPSGIARKEKFSEMFSGDPRIRENVDRFETPESLAWFSEESRRSRNPRWIAWSSIDCDPSIEPVYREMIKNLHGFRIVFDSESPAMPWWAYPRFTEFVRNRLTIWEKEQGAAR